MEYIKCQINTLSLFVRTWFLIMASRFSISTSLMSHFGTALVSG